METLQADLKASNESVKKLSNLTEVKQLTTDMQQQNKQLERLKEKIQALEMQSGTDAVEQLSKNFDESFKIAGDFDWFVRAQKAGHKFQYLDETLTSFALGGVSTRQRFLATKEMAAILKKHQFNPFLITSYKIYENSRNFLSIAKEKLLS